MDLFHQRVILGLIKSSDAAKKLDCDSIHPGYGFLSENPKFADLCKDEGLIFIGPPCEALHISGDKVRARKVASKVAPVVDGYEVSQESDAIKQAERIGYPVILKAVEGGGGRGLRIVKSSEEFKKAFISSQSEAMISFGSDRLYIERYLENPRHIECTDSRRQIKRNTLGRKGMFYSATPSEAHRGDTFSCTTKEMRSKIIETAIAIMKEIGYENAGTVEFLFKDGKFYFMEVNARIQVEHPITEMVTGVDIVEQQIHVALGNGLSIKQQDIKSRGHAIECRINAEHPISFIPFQGIVKKFIAPEGDGIRVDTALYSGYSIPIFYDSLIAKLICFGKDRNETIEKMKHSLMSFRISGIPSTIPFHISSLNDRRFVDGIYDTSFVNEIRPFSSKDGEIAAAILSLLPKRIEFIRIKEEDPWMSSRFDWIDSFDIQHISSRWSK